MHRKRVREIMHAPVITVTPETLAAEAAALLEEHGIRRLPVVDEQGHLIGIATHTDLVEAEVAESQINPYDPAFDEEWLTVQDVMTEDVVTIGPEATVGELVQLMLESKTSGIPVVEPDPRAPTRLRVVGMVTETDIFRMILAGWQAEDRGAPE